jgi:hypothetical protein
MARSPQGGWRPYGSKPNSELPELLFDPACEAVDRAGDPVAVAVTALLEVGWVAAGVAAGEPSNPNSVGCWAAARAVRLAAGGDGRRAA